MKHVSGLIYADGCPYNTAMISDGTVSRRKLYLIECVRSPFLKAGRFKYFWKNSERNAHRISYTLAGLQQYFQRRWSGGKDVYVGIMYTSTGVNFLTAPVQLMFMHPCSA